MGRAMHIPCSHTILYICHSSPLVELLLRLEKQHWQVVLHKGYEVGCHQVVHVTVKMLFCSQNMSFVNPYVAVIVDLEF